MKTPLIMAALIAATSIAAAAENIAVPFRNVKFEDAAKAALAENKIVFIDFYTTWCAPCKRLDRETWTDVAVAKLVGEKAVALRMDAEKEGEALANKYAIKAYPTLLLLKPDGSELDRIVGFHGPADFVAAFTEGAKGNNAVKRAEAAVAEAQQKAPAAKTREEIQARQKLARELAMAGKNEEALREYLWLFDEGMKAEPSFVGVRTSFLTSEIGQLAKVYPPAAEALRERRDAAKARILASATDRAAAGDFASLNDALGDNAANLAFFNELPAGDSRRRTLGARVYQALVEQHRYADALEARPYQTMVMLLSQAERASRLPEEMRQRLRQHSIESAATDIEVLAGAGKIDEAKKLQEKVLELDSSEATKAMIKERLERAGKPDALAEMK